MQINFEINDIFIITNANETSHYIITGIITKTDEVVTIQAERRLKSQDELSKKNIRNIKYKCLDCGSFDNLFGFDEDVNGFMHCRHCLSYNVREIV